MFTRALTRSRTRSRTQPVPGLFMSVLTFPFFPAGILRYRVDFQSMDMDPDMDYYDDDDDEEY